MRAAYIDDYLTNLKVIDYDKVNKQKELLQEQSLNFLKKYIGAKNENQ